MLCLTVIVVVAIVCATVVKVVRVIADEKSRMRYDILTRAFYRIDRLIDHVTKEKK